MNTATQARSRSPRRPLVLARGAAAAWLLDHPVGQGGYVIVYGSGVPGWTLNLDNPRRWCPGCIAVPVDAGACFLAVGGDDDRGAARWEEIPA